MTWDARIDFSDPAKQNLSQHYYIVCCSHGTTSGGRCRMEPWLRHLQHTYVCHSTITSWMSSMTASFCIDL
jgi:hypothetical protein